MRFVWIMGADNLSQFHLWRHWREIADLTPILVIDRPGSTLRALGEPRGACLARLIAGPKARAANLANLEPPAFLFLHGPRSEPVLDRIAPGAQSKRDLGNETLS